MALQCIETVVSALHVFAYFENLTAGALAASLSRTQVMRIAKTLLRDEKQSSNRERIYSYEQGHIVGDRPQRNNISSLGELSYYAVLCAGGGTVAFEACLMHRSRAVIAAMHCGLIHADIE